MTRAPPKPLRRPSEDEASTGSESQRRVNIDPNESGRLVMVMGTRDSRQPMPRPGERIRCRDRNACAKDCSKLIEFSVFSRCRARPTNQPPLKIHVPIASVQQLLDSGNPFAYPRIAPDASDHIVARAWDGLEFAQDAWIIVDTYDPSDYAKLEYVKLALRNTFRAEAKMEGYALTRATAEGCSSLVISIVIVLVCLAFIIPIVYVYGENFDPWFQGFMNIIIVVFWVAVWHPVESLLYGRFLIRARKRVCTTLGQAHVSMRVINPEEEHPRRFGYVFERVAVIPPRQPAVPAPPEPLPAEDDLLIEDHPNDEERNL